MKRPEIPTVAQGIGPVFPPPDRSYRWIAVLALAAPCLACSRSPEAAPGQQNSSAAQDAKVPPTNDLSAQLLFMDDATRFATMKLAFDHNDKNCEAVTKAVFEGGIDGTDEWAVACSDGGIWRVWFKPGPTLEFDRCSKEKCG